MPRTRRSYTKEFKAEAVRLVLEQGLRASEVARDLGIDSSVIADWLNKAKAASASVVAVPGVEAGVSVPPAVEAELRRLQRENAILREEREILKKAAAFFAKETR